MVVLDIRRAIAVIVLGGVFAVPAQAQYPYPYDPYVRGRGATLQGQASVINASGNYSIQTEQARSQREVAEQAKLDTKKKAFDLRLYEKALTISYSETSARNQALFLRRVMTNPQEAEITNGVAQNTMLPFLHNLALGGVSGPPMILDTESLKLINVTVGTDGYNIGILKNGGKLTWPLGVRGPTQQKLALVLPRAVEAAANDTLDVPLYNEVSKGVTKLQDELLKKLRKEELDSGMYLEGKRFLDSLESSVKALRQPTASKLLSGSLAATGQTVPELVENMTRSGLKFAPALPGSEAPYFGLYAAMVSYGNGAMDSQAFQTQFAPVNVNQAYYEKSLKYKR